jgi:hypothetical protein
MVLENASDPAENVSFQDGAPLSDHDPYSASNSTQPTAYQIDIATFPKPIPIIGPLLGYNAQFYSKVLEQKLAHSSSVLQRPLTNDEANAFAYYTAKQISIYSYGTPAGTAAGLWRCYGTAGTFRFPFWQPNLENFQAEIFPPKMAVFRGHRAVVAWHAIRSLAYGSVGSFVGQILFGSYSMSVAAVGELSDKRLKTVIEAIRAKAQQQRGSLPNAPPQIPPQTTGNVPQDDASPTGGMFGSEDTNYVPASMGETPQPETRKRPWPVVKPIPAPSGYQEPSDKPFSMFDDVSPTSGQDEAEDTTPTPPQGSAWERLRRGEKPVQRNGPASQQRPSQDTWSRQQNERQGSTAGDSFAFSKTEEERNYAKEEAQKEFDARVERERRGGDFAQASSEQKRW